MSDTAATTLVSLATLKTWLRAPASADTTNDPLWIEALDSATAEIEQQTGLIFVTRAVSDVMDGTGRSDQWLSRKPTVSVTGVTIDGVPVDASAYVLDSAFGRLRHKTSVWPTGIGNVAVAYTAGYGAKDAATLPQDVVRACLDLAKAIFDELVSGAITLSSISQGPGSMTLKVGDMPPSVERVLRRWRDVRA